MALETERSSPSGASSPGPSRDVTHRRPSSPHSSPPALGPSASPPLCRFEPEAAHGDTSGPPPLPPPPPPPLGPHDSPFRLPPHPSPSSASASPCSPSSSYYAASPPLGPPIYHHAMPYHLPHFAPPLPPTSIVAPQAILAAGVALGGLALHPPPPPDPATVCGWPPELMVSSPPARPLPHRHPHLAIAHHHALLRLRPEDSSPRAPRHLPQAPPPAPTPLPFSVDNILRPAFGLRAVLEEEERGRRRLLLGAKDASPPPPKKKKKAPEAPAEPPRDPPAESGPQSTQASPAAAEEDEGKASEPKLPNPEKGAGKEPMLWPAWVYCTRYSDRPSSGPRSRRVKRKPRSKGESSSSEEKRPRTAFSAEQLSRLKQEFAESRYLTEKRRQALARDLRLNESQIKIWFQNKRAKIKKASGQKGGLALQLMAQGLYNHSTVPVDEEEEEEMAAAEEEKRRQAAASMVIPSAMAGGGPPLDTRPPPLLVER